MQFKAQETAGSGRVYAEGEMLHFLSKRLSVSNGIPDAREAPKIGTLHQLADFKQVIKSDLNGPRGAKSK
jgi:hypothetical protein